MFGILKEYYFIFSSNSSSRKLCGKGKKVLKKQEWRRVSRMWKMYPKITKLVKKLNLHKKLTGYNKGNVEKGSG